MAKDAYQYFRIEARELLEKLSAGAMDLEKGQIGKDLVGSLLRLAHTLKGAARVVKQVEMADLAHAMEDLLEDHREGAVPVPREQAAHLLRLVDACSERLQPLLSAAGKSEEPAPDRDPEKPFASVRVEIARMDELLYALAETAVHLGALAQETETLGRSMAATDRLLNSLAAPADNRSTKGGLPVGELRSLAEEIRADLRLYRQSISAGLERSQRDFGRVRERLSDLRLLPVQAICPFLERSVRDAAESLKKQVVFEIEGEDHRLDAHVLLAVRDALLHVVRNAVAHGIEPQTERIKAGKSAVGHVCLRVRKRGQFIAFVVEDDGRGLDVAAIQRRAVQHRHLTPGEEETLPIEEAIEILWRGGITTAPGISEVSGRGVGLDVVRSTAARLKGSVSLQNKPGQGVTMEIVVPVSLESVTVVAVTAGDTLAYVPFGHVVRALRLSPDDLVRSLNGFSLVLDDRAIPFQPLENLLGAPRARRAAARLWTAVVVQAGTQRAAIGVDGAAGIRDLVVRPLPALCGPVPLIAGATLDEQGNPVLVLDPTALVAAVLQAGAELTPTFSPQRLPVLVVDDSLTTRMLEQSILEAAGFQVDLATSGEEAVERARQKRYAIFIVDVEMPGISGFELLERFRSDPNLHDIPAILVTSRAAPEDRIRGERAGARAYIVKSEFHEAHLLRTIRALIGGSSP